MDKRIRSTSLYYSRQCGIVLNRVFTRSSKRPAISTCILNTFAGSLLNVCWIVYTLYKPRSDRINDTVVCFMTLNCRRKLRKQYPAVRTGCGLKNLTVLFYLNLTANSNWQRAATNSFLYLRKMIQKRFRFRKVLRHLADVVNLCSARKKSSL